MESLLLDAVGSDRAMDRIPLALAGASPRLPRRLELISEGAPVVLVGLRRGHELVNFTPPFSLRVMGLDGRAVVSSSGVERCLGRLDECILSADSAWSIRAIESCDLLLLEAAISRSLAVAAWKSRA